MNSLQRKKNENYDIEDFQQELNMMYFPAYK